MSARVPASRHWLLVPVIATCAAAAALHGQQKPAVPGAIRTAVTLVPVDVRVLDRNGNPVTDLKAEDFTILEERAVQQISQFSAEAFVASGAAAALRPTLRQSTGLEATPPSGRTFLIVLGRGRHEDVAKGFDGLIELVRDRLLPQDQVAIVGYNRATDITSDHGAVARLLERLRSRHTSIESKLDHHFSGLQLAYGSRVVPDHIQRDIDDAFADPAVPAARELPPTRFLEQGRIDDDLDRVFGEDDIIRRPESLEALAAAREAYDDLLNLYMGIEYLRFLEGEKHLIHMTEQGMVGLVASESSNSLAAIAADARVAIHTIQTGGVPGGFISGRWPPPIPGRSWAQTWAMADSRALADRTGGVASFYGYADRGASRIDRATRFRYVLGYSPSDATWDGTYRRITVSVKRPGVTVLYRHGYYAREELVPYDRRQFLTYTRMASAGAWGLSIRDIELAIEAPAPPGADGELEIAITLNPSTISFREEDGLQVASLDLAVFAGEGNNKQAGESRERIDVRLDATAYARVMKDGMVHRTRLKAVGRPKYLKAIVYQYDVDRLGTVTQKIR